MECALITHLEQPLSSYWSSPTCFRFRAAFIDITPSFCTKSRNI